MGFLTSSTLNHPTPKPQTPNPNPRTKQGGRNTLLSLFFTLVTGPRRSLSLTLSDKRVYEPQIRARLGITAHFCKVVEMSHGQPLEIPPPPNRVFPSLAMVYLKLTQVCPAPNRVCPTRATARQLKHPGTKHNSVVQTKTPPFSKKVVEMSNGQLLEMVEGGLEEIRAIAVEVYSRLPFPPIMYERLPESGDGWYKTRPGAA